MQNNLSIFLKNEIFLMIFVYNAGFYKMLFFGILEKDFVDLVHLLQKKARTAERCAIGSCFGCIDDK